MIATLTGTVQHIGIEHLIVQVGGSIGLHVCVPKNVIDKLHQTNEKTISLFTHLVVRETELSLYGFGSDEDRELFLLLIKVNKIGPKLATTILSSLSPEMIKSAVAHEEPAILQRVPGVGKKSAETIILSLRGKLDSIGDGSSLGLAQNSDADVIEALTALGFSIVEAQSALQKLPRDVTDINERIGRALQNLDKS